MMNRADLQESSLEPSSATRSVPNAIFLSERERCGAKNGRGSRLSFFNAPQESLDPPKREVWM